MARQVDSVLVSANTRPARALDTAAGPSYTKPAPGVRGSANKKGVSNSQEGLGCSGNPPSKPVTLGERALSKGLLIFDVFSQLAAATVANLPKRLARISNPVFSLTI
jgi:hypothetical protein